MAQMVQIQQAGDDPWTGTFVRAGMRAVHYVGMRCVTYRNS